MIYISDKVAVTTAGKEIIFPEGSFKIWSVYPTDGNITVEIYSSNGYGQLIYGFNGIGLGDTFGGTKIRIIAVTGTVIVAYYLRG